MRAASTWSTTPERRAAIAAPESRATVSSMPVPTSGASACSSGTAWRCMFEPISARLASSFSRNGISEAATETSCLGLTSISVIWSRGAIRKSPARRAEMISSPKVPSLLSLGVGLGDRVLGLFHRRQIDDLVGHLIVDDLAVRRFDEAVLVDPAEAGEAVDQADVRAFRSLDRADPAVVGRVDVADFEAGALTRQTARPERRNAALVGHFATAGWSGP